MYYLFVPFKLSLVFSSLWLNTVQAQELTLLTRLPPIASETSGILAPDPNLIWTFNDSGGETALYACDTLGNLLRTLVIADAWNRDWEDIAQDDQGNVYIGNIGNNTNDQTDLSIFKIPHPDSVTGDTVNAELIQFSYSDQFSFPPPDDSLHFDCEALMWHAGHLYLVSKNRTVPFDGQAHLYRLPDSAGTYVAEKISSFDTGGSEMFTYWITAADISPDGTKVCILSSDKMWLFYDFVGDDFFSGQSLQIDFPHTTQKEAICFVSDSELYVTDEEWPGNLGRNLYTISLPALATQAEPIALDDWPFSIFPIPCSDQLTLSGSWQSAQLEILDLSGKSLFRLDTVPAKTVLDLQGLPDGALILRIKNHANGKLLVRRLWKQE